MTSSLDVISLSTSSQAPQYNIQHVRDFWGVLMFYRLTAGPSGWMESRIIPVHESLFWHLPSRPCLLTQSPSPPRSLPTLETQCLHLALTSQVHSPTPCPELITSHILEFLQGPVSVFCFGSNDWCSRQEPLGNGMEKLGRTLRSSNGYCHFPRENLQVKKHRRCEGPTSQSWVWNPFSCPFHLVLRTQ